MMRAVISLVLASVWTAACAVESANPVLVNGVTIYTTIEQDMFPPSWKGSRTRASAKPLHDSERDRSLELLRKAIGKYPDGFLKKHVRKVYVAHSLSFYGLSYGGTNSTDRIYLANRGARRGYTDSFFEGSFHHELSSILLRRHRRKVPRREWIKFNDPATPYRSNGTQAVKEGTASTRYSSKYQEKGFLAQYATASFEEDFNMMAEGLLTGSKGFWKAVDSHPRIESKCGLLIKFYGELDPFFTEEYFRALAKTR